MNEADFPFRALEAFMLKKINQSFNDFEVLFEIISLWPIKGNFILLKYQSNEPTYFLSSTSFDLLATLFIVTLFPFKEKLFSANCFRSFEAWCNWRNFPSQGPQTKTSLCRRVTSVLGISLSAKNNKYPLVLLSLEKCQGESRVNWNKREKMVKFT